MIKYAFLIFGILYTILLCILFLLAFFKKEPLLFASALIVFFSAIICGLCFQGVF